MCVVIRSERISFTVILFITEMIGVYLLSAELDQQARAIGSSPLDPIISNFSKYENSSFGMSIIYPADWKKVEDYSGSWFRNINESANVRLESSSAQNRTIDEITISQLNLTKNQFPGQKLLESNATRIGDNYPAHKIVFTFPEEPADPKGMIFKELKMWTTAGDKVYVITYFTTASSYNYYLPLITKMVSSFRIYS